MLDTNIYEYADIQVYEYADIHEYEYANVYEYELVETQKMKKQKKRHLVPVGVLKCSTCRAYVACTLVPVVVTDWY